MTAETKQEIARLWTDLTLGQKTFRGAVAVVVFLLSLSAKMQGWHEVPSRISRVEARVDDLEESRRFQNCWMLESGAGRDPNVCRYLLEKPDDFRPPYTPAVEP